MIRCVFQVCASACIYFICLSVGGYETTDIKLHNFRALGSSVGRVSACVCIGYYDLSIGEYGTTDIKLLNFCR